MADIAIPQKRSAECSKEEITVNGQDSSPKILKSCHHDAAALSTTNMAQASPFESWKKFPMNQNAFADTDPEQLSKVEKQLQALPPLVQHNEVIKLRRALVNVCEGRSFILQAGDCAERFLDCSKELIEAKLKIILQMSVALSWAGRLPVVKIGRIAGQYAKPRSLNFETIAGKSVFTFRGDCVNGFDPEDRVPDPERLVKSYFYASSTLNFIRSLISSGFADLKELNHWKLDFVNSKKRREEYDGMVTQMLNALHFMDTCGVTFGQGKKSIDFYTSHEALVLPYEAGMTRVVDGKYYNLGAHMVWIGERTRQLNHSHVEYCRNIENPIGVKLGPTITPTELVQLCKIVNPTNEPGKLILISRMGASRVKECLPPLLKAVTEEKLKVIWQCDPMHGNTETTSSKVKTRQFDVILEELISTCDIHQAYGTFLGGVHLELTGEDVTECVGGPQELCEKDLSLRYTTYCDPRLNYAQSMEIAFQLAKKLSNNVVTKDI